MFYAVDQLGQYVPILMQHPINAATGVLRYLSRPSSKDFM